MLKIIRDLNMHKAHGHDDIFIRTINRCDKSLLPPLILLFHNSVKSPCYPDIWKRSNIIPVHKKSDKQLKTASQFFSFNQLLAITHETFEAFSSNPSLEVRSVFLDILKAHNKVWYQGLLYKLKSMGNSWEFYDLLENCRSGRFQRVVLNGQTSSWKVVLVGIPQGSILGPFLSLIYINDLPSELKTNTKLFTDDTSLFTIVKDVNEIANALNIDLCLISKWAFNWKFLFNPDPSNPTREVLFSSKKKLQTHPTVSLNYIQVERAAYQKHLGILL